MAQRTGWWGGATPDGSAAEYLFSPVGADGDRILHLRPGGDQPGAVRPAGGRIGAGRRLQRRILVDDLRALLPRRIHQHDPDGGDDPPSCSSGGWLPPLEVSWLTWIPGPIWFGLKIAFCLFLFIWVRATLPRYRYDQLMRPGLEGVPADVAVVGGGDRRPADGVRPGTVAAG